MVDRQKIKEARRRNKGLMKKGSIIAIGVIAIAIAILVSTFGQASSYESFDGAYKKYEAGEKSDVHVVGELVKNADGSLKGYVYDPLVDPNRCEFIVIDSLARVEPVVLLKSKPADFEKSEKVVLIGRFRESGFVASDVLLKCPSKYENEAIK